MKIARSGHSTIQLTSDRGVEILIDPYISDNPLVSADLKNPEYLRTIAAILLSHAHLDHTGGIADVIKVNPDVQVACHQDLAPIIERVGAKNVTSLDIGGTFACRGVTATMVSAAHGGAYGWEERKFAGAAAGYVITLEEGFKIYYAGDAGLSADMKLVIGDYFKPDLAILPVGGVFTMDPEQAAYAAGEFIKPRIVIPTHYYPGPEAYPDALSVSQRPQIARASVGNGEELKALIDSHYPRIKTIVLDPGESCEVTSTTR